MRHLTRVAIVLLCVALASLYVVDRRTMRELQERIRALESSAQQVRDEYETKLATLRAEHSARTRDQAGPAAGGSLLGLLLNSPILAKPHYQESFREVVQTLGLDPEQHARVNTVLDEFTTARREIVLRAAASGASVAQAPHADAMRRLQRDTLGRLRQVMKPAQYAEFLRLGYDRSLGLTPG